MPIRKRNARKARARPKKNMSSFVEAFDTNHPENYLDLGFAGVSLGNATGAIGTGSIALNTSLMNTSTGTGLEIQPGTGVSSRLGLHIILTRLMVRLYATCTGGSRVRVMIFVNPRDNTNTTGGVSTNTALTAVVEATPFLRAGSKAVGGTQPGAIDWNLDPACDYQLLYDRMYGPGDHSSSFSPAGIPLTVTTQQPIGSAVIPIELDIDLKIPVMYNNAGYPQVGDLIIYMTSSNANAWAGNLNYPTVQLTGSMRLAYVNAMNLEAIGRSIRDFVDEAATTAEHVSKSPFMKFLQAAAPYVTRIFGGR